ncbi:MAG: hypothetical protein IT379_11980 [Deltaproteobacteria bacterium]|nr:hypothetical protein [Deltaproteobacteria bacterium]
MSEICRHRTLARGPLAHVQQCTGCGCVSIHFGATTVRVDAGALRSIATVLHDATAHLSVEPVTRWTTAPPGTA